MSRTFHHKALVITVLLAAFFLRVTLAVDKNTLEYDEAISYLAATCHQVSYAQETGSLTPQPAAYWQAYFQVERPYCLEEISTGLAQTDIHPPLYFWLLHIWSLMFNVTLWSGPLLNSFIAVLTAALVYRLAYEIGNGRDALLVLVTYTLNPSVLAISMEARQYELLAGWTVLLVWQTRRAFAKSGPSTHHIPGMIILSLIIAAGWLTHFDFILPVSGLTIFIIFKYRQRLAWLQFRYFWAAVLVGGLAAAATFPAMFAAIGTVAERAPSFSMLLLSERFQKVGTAVIGYSYLFIPLLLRPWFKWHKQTKPPALNRHHWLPIFIGVWVGTAVILRYLAFLTPTHTLGPPKYLAMVWPFLAFTPIYIKRMMPAWRSLPLYFYLTPIILGVLFPTWLNTTRPQRIETRTAGADWVIVDTIRRGELLPIIWQVPPQTAVVAAPLEILVKAYPAWLPPPGTPAIWVSELNENPPNLRQNLLDLMDDQDVIIENSQNLSTLTSNFTLYQLTVPIQQRK